jgi:hypothetical protein
MNWEQFNRLLNRYPLLPARVIHSMNWIHFTGQFPTNETEPFER